MQLTLGSLGGNLNRNNMKRISFLIFSIFCTTYLYSQDDPAAIFNSHVFPCDSGSTTLETNLCSGEKFEFADSLLNRVYKKILKAIDKDTQDDKRRLLDKSSKQETSSEVNESIKFLKEEIAHNDRLKKSIVESQKQWIKYRDANAEAVRITCETGTACITEVNDSLINDTLDRIKTLRSLYDVED